MKFSLPLHCAFLILGYSSNPGMKPVCSSETSAGLTGLHNVVSQNVVLFVSTAVGILKVQLMYSYFLRFLVEQLCHIQRQNPGVTYR
jgi:hypothetical protein